MNKNMTEVPSKRRCYPVEYCAECQGRLPMRHLYKPYGMMSHHNIVDVDSEFANRWVCTETDDNREIKLHPSLDFPDWCPLKVIPDDSEIVTRQQGVYDVLEQLVFALHCYEQDVLDSDFPAPSKHTDMMQQAENLLAQIKTKESWFERHDAAIRNAVLDELGILHGEDAKRFNEQLDHPEPLTPEARDLVVQAKEIAKRERTALDYSERIRNLEEIISLSEKLLHQFPDDFSLKMSMQQASQELKRLESLRSETANQRSKQ